MYEYGSMASRSPLLSEAADDFMSFAGMHLMCTMFITTDRGDGAQGVFHRTLDPLGYGSLLDEVDRVLDLPVGRTTFRQFLRSKRNKLAVHGTLAFSAQPKEVQDVTLDEAALEQVEDALAELDTAVRDLNRELAELEAAGPLP
jgi:hypothetical protein